MKRQGFTIVEILIVIGIIGLLLSISLPNLFTAKMNATTNIKAVNEHVDTIEDIINKRIKFKENVADGDIFPVIAGGGGREMEDIKSEDQGSDSGY